METRDRRSGIDRRAVEDRRKSNDPNYKGPERRRGKDRRALQDRRSLGAVEGKVNTGERSAIPPAGTQNAEADE